MRETTNNLVTKKDFYLLLQ